jgi:thymidylate synthase ThyX
VLYAEVPRSEIARYRFLLEGYDNLAVMSVVDRYRAVIKLRCSPDAQKELRELLASQGARIMELG